MRELPHATDLLETARRVLIKELLPDLPSTKRYQGLMIANAMAIALRDIGSDPAGESALTERLRGLLDASEGDFGSLSMRFGRDLRAGRFDPGTVRHAEAMVLLADLTRHRCGISNPKAL